MMWSKVIVPNVKHPTADRLARQRVRPVGGKLTGMMNALRAFLARLRRPHPSPLGAFEILTDAQERLARLPVLDSRTPDQILGYDESGLPR